MALLLQESMQLGNFKNTGLYQDTYRRMYDKYKLPDLKMVNQ